MRERNKLKILMIIVLALALVNIFLYEVMAGSWTDGLNNGLNQAYTFETTNASNTLIVDVRNTQNGSTPQNIFSNNGISGKAIMINGTSDYVNLGIDKPNMSDTSNVTISLWIKTNDSSGDNALIGSSSIAGSWEFSLNFASPYIRLYNGDTGNNDFAVNMPTNIANGSWFNIVMVRGGLTNNRIYVNGVNQSLVIDAAKTNLNEGRMIQIGNSGRDNYSAYIDEFYIWNRTLTDSEIKSLYDTFYGGTSSPVSNSSIFYNTSILEGENNTIYFYFNSTTDLTNVSANLTYNNVVYNMSYLINGLNVTYYKTVIAPIVTTDTLINLSINFTINGTLITGSNINYSQLVLNTPNLTIGNCTPKALYITLVDEENLSLIDTGTFEYNFYYGVTNSTAARVYGSVSGNNFSVCINDTISNNWTLGYGEIFYRADNYVDRRYYFFSGTHLTNSTVNITLHDLLSTRQTSFKLEVESSSLNPYINKYASLIRWYPDLNEYRTVDMGLTDENGNTVIHVKTEDVDYRIGIYETNGTLIKLANPIRMVCLVSPCTYTLRITPSENDFISFLGVQYTLTFNETTGIWLFTFSDNSGKINTMNLTVYKETTTSSIYLCSDIVTGTSGAITCNTSGYTGTLKATVTRQASPAVIITEKIVSISTSAFKSAYGLWISLLLAIPIIFIFALMSPVVALFGGVIALIPAWYFGSVNLIIIGGFAVLAAIVAHFLKRIG